MRRARWVENCRNRKLKPIACIFDERVCIERNVTLLIIILGQGFIFNQWPARNLGQTQKTFTDSKVQKQAAFIYGEQICTDSTMALLITMLD